MRTYRGDMSKNIEPRKASKLTKPLTAQGGTRERESTDNASGNPIGSSQKKNEAVVHTFKDDVQHLVRNKKISMTRIAALEADRDERTSADYAQGKREPWKTTYLVALIILFLVIGSVLAMGVFYAYQLNTAPNVAPQFEPTIIFTEARENIDVTDKNARGIMTTLASARRNTIFSLGSVVELYLTRALETEQGQTTEHLDAVDFLESIDANVPGPFLQTLESDYALGVNVIDENVPFLILTTQSYGYAFAGMLAWEAYLEEDLTPFFSPNVEYAKPAVAEGENAFSDTVVQNLDVRVLRDSDGDIRVLYAFINRNTVIITTNIRTLVELASRLRVAET
tara:strand:+ start:7898 stop:8914 length:1017 start_codon:yes stop_codon:yes gene_type:complete